MNLSVTVGTSGFLRFLLASAALVLSGSALAQDVTKNLKLNPLYPQSVANQVASAANSTGLVSPQAAWAGDPRLDALSHAISRWRANSSTLAGTENKLDAAHAAESSPQVAALLRLFQQSADADVRFHKGSGTVRHLKGMRLHPADSSDESTAKDFLHANRTLLKIDAPRDEFQLAASETDELGRRHLRFQQYFQGVRVWPAEVIVHLDAWGNVDLLNGAYAPTPTTRDVAPTLDAAAAEKLARAALSDSRSAELTSNELVHYLNDDRTTTMAWKVELRTAADSHWRVVVDAINGAILAQYNQVPFDGNAQGSGTDLLGVNRSLNVYAMQGGYWLFDTSKSMYSAQTPVPGCEKTYGCIVIYDARHTPADNKTISSLTSYYITSGASASGWLADGVSAAWSFSQVYDYFLERHNRKAIDGNGSTVRGIVRFGVGYHNAFWSDDYGAMFFGDADKYAGALDVIAHEMTHGITSRSSKLEYRNQSGALNEAMSDIFGVAVYARSNGVLNWVIGKDMERQLRNLKDPHAIGSWACNGKTYRNPANMAEFMAADSPALACFTGKDNGGVHINSLIISQAFYQLVEGLPGAIGIRDAERIFYRALTQHLSAKSQFLDARIAAVTSAEELFGKGSAQATMVGRAFDAVQIYDASPLPPPPSGPAVNAADSVFFLRNVGNNNLGLFRREAALMDATSGRRVASAWTLAYEKMSIAGNGNLMAFVSADNDVCLMGTDGGNLACIGQPNSFHSLALSADANFVATVLLDANGSPTNKVWLIDVVAGTYQSYQLTAYSPDNSSPPAIGYADLMTFTSDKKRLFFDAATTLSLPGGSSSTTWGVYMLDLASGLTVSVVQPTPEYIVANPSLSHTRDDLLLFDVYDASGQNTTTLLADLTSNSLLAVGIPGKSWGYPSFTGDDLAVVFSHEDSSVPTGSSLWKQTLTNNRTSIVGSPVAWVADADIGVVYRRGTYSAPPTVSPQPGLWWNPARSGYGFDVQRVGSLLTVVWYTYNADGTPTWYFGSCQLSDQQCTVALDSYTWDWNASKATPHAAGSLTLNFTDNQHAAMSWALGGRTGTDTLQYFSYATGRPATNYTGLWYAPSIPGFGLSVGTQGALEIAVLYFYDSAGNPRWAFGSGNAAANNTVPLDSYIGFCPWCSYRAAQGTNVGSITHAFTSTTGGALLSSIQLKSPLSGGWFISQSMQFQMLTDPQP